MREMLIATVDDLKILAGRVLKEMSHPRALRAGATVLALHGELGAGKTAFVQCLARVLGIAEQVTSPTFVIMRLYSINKHDFFRKLVHIDAYRIESLDEMAVIGFEDLVREPRNLICIEWAERIPAAIPKDALHITFSHGGASERDTFRKAVYGYST